MNNALNFELKMPFNVNTMITRRNQQFVQYYTFTLPPIKDCL